MRSKLDNLFEDLENIGRENQPKENKCGWNTVINDSFAVANREETIIPSGYRPAHRTQGIRAGHRVTVSFISATD